MPPDRPNANEHDPALVLYITQSELSELRKGFAQFSLFMGQQIELNKWILGELKELKGDVQESEDTKRDLKIEELKTELKRRDDAENNAKWAKYGIIAAIAVGLLGGGCSLTAAWMSYTQPRVQTINATSGGK